MDAFFTSDQWSQFSEQMAFSETISLLTGWGGFVYGIVSLAVGLWFLVPPTDTGRRWAGGIYLVQSLVLLFIQAPVLAGIIAPALFWILVAITILPAAAAISSKDPVYSALWFALCLLGVAGLFLYQGALFLGIATVAVYAGAIVVTFLFVLMLAQPEGHALYDRVGWGRVSTGVACAATASLVAVLVYAYSDMNAGLERNVASLLEHKTDTQGASLVTTDQLRGVRLSPMATPEEGGVKEAARLELLLTGEQLSQRQTSQVESFLAMELVELSENLEIELKYIPPDEDVLAVNHVAHLGDQLFGPHLIGVEIAGALLLAALVGAVAIATRGDESRVEAGIGKKGGAV